MKLNKAALIVNGYVLKESPSIYFFCKLLKDNDYNIDIFYNCLKKEDEIEYNKIDVNICAPQSKTIFIFNIINSLFKYVKRLAPEKVKIQYLDKYLSAYVYYLKKIDFRKYQILIIIEPEALLLYHYLKLDVPFTYWSLELNNLSFEKTSEIAVFKKQLEKKYLKKSIAVIIQDNERKRILQIDNNLINDSKFCFLPVSIAGKICGQRNYYFNQKFNIPDDKIIVLYAGSICDWAAVDKIIESSKKWDDKFVLIVHSGRCEAQYLEYLKKLSADSNNIYFNIEWVEYDKLDLINSSADIGISLYCDASENYRNTLFSSGKIAAYLKCGLPIIINNYALNYEFCKNNNCGEVITNYEALPEKLNIISNSLSRYRECAFETFKKYYDFESKFNQILKIITENQSNQ